MIEQLLIDETYLVQLVGGALLVHPGAKLGDMFASDPGDVIVIVLGPDEARKLYPLCRHEAEVREWLNGLLWPLRG